MADAGRRPLISVHPDELKFTFELEKQSNCDLKVVNNTEQHVAFKVKTTSPKKYFVRPNSCMIRPQDSCPVRVTLQAQHEYPPDMQCKDKFLLQSTIVPPDTDDKELSPDTFNKRGGRLVEECRLGVVYIFPSSPQEKSGEEAFRGSIQSPDDDMSLAVQRMKDERDAAVRQAQLLQKDIDMMKTQRSRRTGRGFSFMSALLVAFIGVMFGFMLAFLYPSGSAE
ncbi:hypothetical protein BT93_E0297 [Corymbia citriodora subsp. variegata]|nr:hypothetical protein BT93_E0297 [Corymbia citriodora subsp. variegata]